MWQKLVERYGMPSLVGRYATGATEPEKAELLAKQGKYQDAENWLQEARSDFESINDEEGVGQVLHTAGTLHAQQANFDA